jgi:hypothetical protein
MTLATGEFIRRFLLHVLPKGFHRIRQEIWHNNLIVICFPCALSFLTLPSTLTLRLWACLAVRRSSSAANVGADKDSDRRQRDAIQAFAKHAGFTVVEEFYDAAVSGVDPIDTRPGFRALLEHIVSNGVRTVIVEDASRFARTLMVQEAGIATLAGLGVQVLTSRGDDLTDSDDEMRVAMLQIAGVFSQLEKKPGSSIS